jgi:hypothetical protein
MKANELRIGNWILSPLEPDQKPRQIIDIDFISSFLNSYRPIPLTEEWLIKFGDWSKSIGASYAYGNFKGYSISNYHKEYWEFEIGGSSDSDRNEHVKIYHVHQLQNLYFALTGEELEIK